MSLYANASFLAAKLETNSGTFEQLYGSDVFEVANLSLTPLDLNLVEVKPMTPYFDVSGSYVASALVKVAFDTPMIGNGNLTSNLPIWADFNRCCGMLQLGQIVAAVHPSSLTCSADGTVATVTAAGHPFKNGQIVYINGATAIGGGLFYNAPTGTYIRNVTADKFDYVVDGSSGSYGVPASVSITSPTQWLLRTRKKDDQGNTIRKTMSFAAYIDRAMHSFYGAIGSLSLTWKAKDVPHVHYEFIGIPVAGDGYVAVNQTPAGAVFNQLADMPVELLVPQYTTCPTLHTLTNPTLYDFSLTQGNKIEYAQPMTGTAYLDITDRTSSASVTLETPDDASLPVLMGRIRSAKRGVFSLSHGSSPNKISVHCRATELGNPRYGNASGISTMQLDMKPRAEDGDDNFIITLT